MRHGVLSQNLKKLHSVDLRLAEGNRVGAAARGLRAQELQQKDKCRIYVIGVLWPCEPG